MFRIIRTRVQQGHRTFDYPRVMPQMPPCFRGVPTLDGSRCAEGCAACVEACPMDAISLAPDAAASLGTSVEQGGVGARNPAEGPRVDLGRCVFCADCVRACPAGAIHLTGEFRMAARRRADLVVGEEGLKLAEALERKSRALFGRSLRLRQVSAGGCNGCEGEINALGTVVFDMGRFGIQVVASPRHADGLLITGPVTANMRLALQKTYDAVPEPKLVIAIGACAISGGPFRDQPQVANGAESLVPVDLYIPGCPPHPFTILDGLLRLLGRIGKGTRAKPRAAAK